MTQTLQAELLSCAIAGQAILGGVTLAAAGSEFIGLLGVNGVGKSTLLDILAGLRTPNSGRVLINGKSLADISAAERARTICHLPQAINAKLPFSVEQIVLMGRYPHADRWMESGRDLECVTDALRRTHCLDFRHRKFSTLSGGERQRVLLSACLAQRADILFLDEPATYLDLRHQLQCFELLREEAARGALCIAVTHDLNLALTHCSRIVILQDGEVERDMSVEEAWRQPSWFLRFSERLRMERSRDDERWLAYR